MAQVLKRLELAAAALLGLWVLLQGDHPFEVAWLAALAGLVVHALGTRATRRTFGAAFYVLALEAVVALLAVGVYFTGDGQDVQKPRARQRGTVPGRVRGLDDADDDDRSGLSDPARQRRALSPAGSSA